VKNIMDKPLTIITHGWIDDTLARKPRDYFHLELNIIDICALEYLREVITDAVLEACIRARLDRDGETADEATIAAHVTRYRAMLDDPTFELLRELVEVIDAKARLGVDEAGRFIVFSCSIALDKVFRL
jgi:hypothetical protein